LLFLLTGGGRQNYAGAKHWLKSVDSRVLESLDFALCLDSLGTGDKLFLHVSKKPKTPEIRSLYDTFRDTAAQSGIGFEVVHRKINISSPNINWQHEQFSRKRRTLVAATLSSKQHPSPLYFGSSIFDTRSSVNVDTLVRNIKFVVEALSRQIYQTQSQSQGNNQLQVAAQSHGINRHFVEAWLDFLGSQSRVSGMAPKKNDVNTEIERVLAQHTADSKQTSFALESGFKFYKDERAQMSLYRVKPFTFDIYLALSIIAYLGALHVLLRGVGSFFPKKSA